MKKFIITIVAFFYLAVSSGFTLHMHYCMGKLADWALWNNESKTCGGCGMEKSEEKDNGCCKDEHKFVKNETDQKAAEASFQMIQLAATALPVLVIELPAVDFPAVTEENPLSHAPPRCNGVAVYIRNCIFLI